MSVTTFLFLLSAFSIISGLVTEGIKNICTNKNNLSYNITALVVALIVGSCGTAAYYQLNSIEFTVNNIIYMVLLGLASGLTAMVGYDKVKGALYQCGFLKSND